ncbi:hypothetical protein DPMN_009853 [Dreissena polymorpha]|uniref:Uncharacterized protein n=1 Tax=Dreissena polymorpha TaxID=45954 RepID=A0A9D4S0F1_DREPO|nr:hypothetical protein DPMN_009853 [Dreissena polymorpha]
MESWMDNVKELISFTMDELLTSTLNSLTEDLCVVVYPPPPTAIPVKGMIMIMIIGDVCFYQRLYEDAAKLITCTSAIFK